MLKYLAKTYATWKGRPYLHVRSFMLHDERLEVDAVYNDIAIQCIENWFMAANRTDFPMQASDQDKIAFYLAEMFAALVNHDLMWPKPVDEDAMPELPPDPLLDPTSGIPVMGGSQPVREVVDIAKTERFGIVR